MKTLIIKPHREAIAMIELIFAIVVVGIALLSVPTLISTSTNSGFVVLQQESINEAAAKLNSILSYHWDEADTDTKFIDPILQTTNSSFPDLNEDGNSGRRKGTPKESYRSFIRADGVRLPASTVLGIDSNDNGEKDDMDDFNGENVSLSQVETATNDYLDTTVSIATSVKYITDAAMSFGSVSINYNPNFNSNTAGTTNVKLIRVTLTSTSGVDELEKTIILQAFGCNIGAVDLVEKRF
jgi:hypothetical protein